MKVMTRFIRVCGLAGLLLLGLTDIGSAFAQAPGVVTRGSFLKKRAYQTYAAMTLYVDPTGSDSNACTASGASACLTIQGAIDKVPKRVRHNVTINVAAGTYVEAVALRGFTFTRELVGTSTTTPVFTLSGAALAAPTLTGGTASGTFTAVAAVASGGYVQRVTDGAQAWTVNELRGHFLTVAGTSRPIVSNTATTIDVVSGTAYAGGTAYTLTTPVVSIAPSSGIGINIASVSNNARFTLTNLTVSGSQAGIIISEVVAPSASYNTMTNLRVVVTGASSYGLQCSSGATCIVNRSYIASTTATAVYCSGGTSFTFSDGYITSAKVSVTSATLENQGAYFAVLSGGMVIENTSATGNPLLVVPSTQAARLSTRGRFICAAGSTGFGILNSPASAGFEIPVTPIRFQNATTPSTTAFEVEGCATGFKGHGDVWLANNTNAATAWYFSNVTTAFNLGYGAKVILGTGSTFTFTGVTTQFSLDGTAYSLTDLDSFTPARITTPYGTLLAR